MKKLLLMVLIFAATASFAQLQTNKTAPKLGYNGAADAGNGDKKLTLNFNASTAVLPILTTGQIANDGKGILSIVMSSEAPVGKVSPINNKKADNWGANCNIYRFRTIKDILDFSVNDTLKAYSTTKQYWKPTNVKIDFNGDTADQVFAAYPGMYKKVNLGFQVAVDGGGLKSDISFEIMTADKGNTTKAAVYKAIISVNKESKFGSAPFLTTLAMDTAKTANQDAYRTAFASQDLWIIDNIYTTRTDSMFKKVKINIAEKLGVIPGYFNGKKVYVTLYTSGTGSNIEPGIYDPVVAIDNVEAVYGPVSWAVPAGVVANAVIDHNNGNPVFDALSSTNYGAGAVTNVIAGSDQPVKIYLTGLNRASYLDITEANDGGTHNPKFSFAATGAVKAKDASGNYTIDVPYTYTPSDGTTKFDLKIAAPAAGVIVNDTIEVTLLANVADAQTSTERLEITNGVRFWYDVAVTGTQLTGAPAQQVKALNIYDLNRTIVAENASSDVTIVNAAGQVVKVVSAKAAAKGIAIAEGAYVVKTGNTIQKVIVK